MSDPDDNQRLVQCAWDYLNNSLLSDVFGQFNPETVACSCIRLAARQLQIPLQNEQIWFLLFSSSDAEIRKVCGSVREILSSQYGKRSDVEELEQVNETEHTGSDLRSEAAVSDRVHERTRSENTIPPGDDPITLSGREESHFELRTTSPIIVISSHSSDVDSESNSNNISLDDRRCHRLDDRRCHRLDDRPCHPGDRRQLVKDGRFQLDRADLWQQDDLSNWTQGYTGQRRLFNAQPTNQTKRRYRKRKRKRKRKRRRRRTKQEMDLNSNDALTFPSSRRPLESGLARASQLGQNISYHKKRKLGEDRFDFSQCPRSRNPFPAPQKNPPPVTGHNEGCEMRTEEINEARNLRWTRKRSEPSSPVGEGMWEILSTWNKEDETD